MKYDPVYHASSTQATRYSYSKHIPKTELKHLYISELLKTMKRDFLETLQQN